ncbi:MAG: Asp-tRNA(Asn)/Glu-tRNA(Gln) amidotransferase subunit GatB [Anaerolineae bacterium]|nr:Asp-tRNA(Asn)/Glu-tRNA(Gln) amidotransferase subunit GatB [Anaerolineae bacterium]
MTNVNTYEPVIGLEVHAELLTRSKMFCACPVVDSTRAQPNTAVCPICAGMPGTLPVVNRQAVAYAIKVGLALGCRINPTSIFERKNYFYPDLPKGYQISQYQHPLAESGSLQILTCAGARRVRINRVHMEEDAGKLVHLQDDGGAAYSLVDLNRAGLPLLEIVTEPDLHSLEEMKAYAAELRAVLRVLGVNSGDMEKGVIRFEANISIRPAGSAVLGKRVEIKNLNSFRTMERAVAHEIERQTHLLQTGGIVEQETRSFDEATGETRVMRSKEDAHDYRYFPEPDLPPLVVGEDWVAEVRETLPELPSARIMRLVEQYGLDLPQAQQLAESYPVADFFEQTCSMTAMPGRTLANWITDSYFAWMNERGRLFAEGRTTPQMLAGLMDAVRTGRVNRATAQSVLFRMLDSGVDAEELIRSQGLEQVSDHDEIVAVIRAVIGEHTTEYERYRVGKVELAHWFFGQVMKRTGGKANPAMVRELLQQELEK